jgi:hypothetical protein
VSSRVRIVSGWLLGVLLLAGAPGCFALLLGPAAVQERIFRWYDTVQFQVIDAETLQPISGATVTVSYGGWGGMKPEDVAGVTDSNGAVSLRIVRDRAPYATALADGYMPSPTRSGEVGPKPPESIQLCIYRLPAPYHILEVPANFHGALRFRLLSPGLERPAPNERPGWRPGERGLVTRLEPDRAVDMHPLPEMGAHASDFDSILAARSAADGEPVPLWLHSRFRAAPPQQDPAPSTRPITPAGDTFAVWELGISSDPAYMSGTVIVVFVGSLTDAALAQQRLRQEWAATLREGLYLLRPLPTPLAGTTNP